MSNAQASSRRPTFAQAKAQYLQRYTLEHVPAWARRPAPNGRYYAPHFRTDAEWYANAKFPEERNGGGGYVVWPLFSRFCETSNQSWPLGQWIDKPLQAAIPVQMQSAA